MARGRLLKSKVKEARKIAEAIKIGENTAEKKKGWEVSLKEHVGKIIDRIDPIKGIAYGATVAMCFYILKNGRDQIIVPLLRSGINLETVGGALTALTSGIFPPGMLVTLPLMALGLAPTAKAGIDVISSQEDWFLLCLSLILAWMIIEYGGEIIRAAGGVLEFAKSTFIAGLGAVG